MLKAEGIMGSNKKRRCARSVSTTNISSFFSLCHFRSRYHRNQHRLEIYVRFNRCSPLRLFLHLFCYSILFVQQVYGINPKTSCKLQLKSQIYQAGENRNECNDDDEDTTAPLICFFGFHSTVCSIHKHTHSLFLFENSFVPT